MPAFVVSLLLDVSGVAMNQPGPAQVADSTGLKLILSCVTSTRSESTDFGSDRHISILRPARPPFGRATKQVNITSELHT